MAGPYIQRPGAREAGMQQVACIIRERQLCLYGHEARLPAEDPVLSGSIGLDHTEGPPACFAVAPGGFLFEDMTITGLRIPWPWSDGGRMSTVVRWARQRAALAHAPPYLT